MTRGERPGDSPAGPPKPSWGPGRNAALSVVAFAAIFGAFALIERNPGRGHASIARDVAGEIGTAVGRYRNAFVAASAPVGAASTAALSASLIPPASAADAEAAAAPQADAGSAAKPPRGADPRHAALATSPHDTSGGARNGHGRHAPDVAFASAGTHAQAPRGCVATAAPTATAASCAAARAGAVVSDRRGPDGDHQRHARRARKRSCAGKSAPVRAARPVAMRRAKREPCARHRSDE